jgi:hypothetical protein
MHNLYSHMLQHFCVIRELQPMPCQVTYILLIAAVDNTIIKCRCFTKAFISSQIVLIKITIFFNEYNLRTYISLRWNILIS